MLRTLVTSGDFYHTNQVKNELIVYWTIHICHSSKKKDSQTDGGPLRVYYRLFRYR